MTQEEASIIARLGALFSSLGLLYHVFPLKLEEAPGVEGETAEVRNAKLTALFTELCNKFLKTLTPLSEQMRKVLESLNLLFMTRMGVNF